jgi:hypothetical protein
MNLETVAQCRVALMRGSWLDCREALVVIGKLAIASQRVAALRKPLYDIIYERCPAASEYVEFQRTLTKAGRTFSSVVSTPLCTHDLIMAMITRDPHHAPRCGLKACSRRVGNYLYEADGWRGDAHRMGQPCGVTDVSSKDDITPSNTGRYGSGPDTLREIGMRLWVFYEEHHNARLYSRRRCRMIKLHTGLFACSVSCYQDIVSAIKLWEGPQEAQQVVVITTKDEYTWPPRG